MSPVRLFLAAITGSVAALVFAPPALAQPSIPATYYGSVTVDGKPATAGTEVRGLVNGIDCTQGEPGSRPVIPEGETTAYVIHIVHDTQRPGCATSGAVVTFTVAGVPAVQQSQWRPGPIRLDLSTGAASPIPLPSATGTVEAALTAAGTIEPGTTSTALPAPSGPPPIDDAQVPGVNSSTTPAPSEGEPTGDEGDSAVPFLLIALAILALAGGAIGVYLARRKRGSAPTEPPEA